MPTKQLAIDEEVVNFLRGVTRRRMSRVAMYGFLAAAAIISAFAPSQVLTSQSNPTVATVWAFSFGIAALTCLIGSIFDRWIAEYTMIPLLASSLIVFGIALIGESQGDAGWRVIPYALFFNAFSLGLIARWRDVRSLLRVAVHLEAE